MLPEFLKRLFSRSRPLSYEEARELAGHMDAKVRVELAGRADLRPEILYYLADDPAPEVRRKVAANQATPPQANLLLAGDADETVRMDVAAKIARLTPGLSRDEQNRLTQLTTDALGVLARDQVAKVRTILADALKDVADAPPDVIRRLARDAEIAVSAPVLQYSPVLTDEDLLAVITASPVPGALAAISRRDRVSYPVTDAIAATDDVDAIAVLLGNASAQIREETLDRLAERATDIESWHQPLISRPVLPAKTAQKLARYVAASLLDQLADRRDLDPEATRMVANVVKRRLEEMESAGPAKAEARKAADGAHASSRARALFADGKLDETIIDTALAGGDHAFVVEALALLADLEAAVVRKAVTTQSAKGIVAVAWKAKLSMALAVELQGKLLRLTSTRIIRPGVGGDYPLKPGELVWHLEFLGAV